jgi:hypothetical protein
MSGRFVNKSSSFSLLGIELRLLGAASHNLVAIWAGDESPRPQTLSWFVEGRLHGFIHLHDIGLHKKSQEKHEVFPALPLKS